MTAMTTRDAARVVGITPGALRREAMRARSRGIVLMLPREEWPDQRTAAWDTAALAAWAASRPGRGARTDLREPAALGKTKAPRPLA